MAGLVEEVGSFLTILKWSQVILFWLVKFSVVKLRHFCEKQLQELAKQGRQVLLVSSGSIGIGREKLNLKAEEVSDRDARNLVNRQACAACGQGLRKKPWAHCASLHLRGGERRGGLTFSLIFRVLNVVTRNNAEPIPCTSMRSMRWQGFFRSCSRHFSVITYASFLGSDWCYAHWGTQGLFPRDECITALRRQLCFQKSFNVKSDIKSCLKTCSTNCRLQREASRLWAS